MPATLIAVRRPSRIAFLLTCASGLPLLIQGQAPATLTPAQAQALVERVLATESRAAQDLSHGSHLMRYRLHKVSPRLTSTKEIVETREGDVARTLEINSQVLGPADAQREESRLQALYDNPGLQQHRKQSEDNDTARALKVLRVLPTAFLYQFAGTADAANGSADRFTFKPNPQFEPPDLETGVLTAMVGEIWIDPVQERVVRLAGTLQQDKEIALGLAELDKGGWVEIVQADVGGHEWRIVHLKLVMNGRILFKSKNSNSVQDYTDFAPLPPDLTYRQAIELLRAGKQ
ncbi:MAG: hypothetical protein ABSF17_01855 [Terracidiphilus sp.]|jgi:hypothetical protein